MDPWAAVLIVTVVLAALAAIVYLSGRRRARDLRLQDDLDRVVEEVRESPRKVSAEQKAMLAKAIAAHAPEGVLRWDVYDAALQAVGREQAIQETLKAVVAGSASRPESSFEFAEDAWHLFLALPHDRPADGPACGLAVEVIEPADPFDADRVAAVHKGVPPGALGQAAPDAQVDLGQVLGAVAEGDRSVQG